MKEFYRKHLIDVIIFVAAFLILLLVGTPGYSLEGDAMQYVTMGGYLPALYPMFLWFFRSIFGEAIYLYIVVVVQCMLGALGIMLILHFVRKEYRIANWILGVFFIMLFAPYVRESMRYVPRYMYSHMILTEAISIPLFYYYIWTGLQMVKRKDIFSFIGMNVFTMLLVLSRAQFQVCLILNCVVLVYLVWVNQRNRLSFLVKGLVIIILTYLLTGFLGDCYKKAILGTTQNAWNSSYFLLHCMYASDAEDVAIYDRDDYKELYDILYQQLDEQHYNYKYQTGRVYDKSMHWSYDFSKIYRDLKETVTEYVLNQGITDEVVQGEKISEYVGNLMKPLLLKNGIKSFGYSLYQFPISMCSNVFVLKENHLWFSYLGTIMIYIIMAVLMVWRFWQKKDSFAVWFMMFILCFMIGNSLVVGYVLHTQARYLLYSMGVFYMALGMICVELWNEKRGLYEENDTNL